MSRCKPSIRSITFFCLVFVAVAPWANVKSVFGQISDDERVILFDTVAHWDGAKAHWRVSLHGWVFEPGDAITPLAVILTGLDMSDVSVTEAQEQRLTRRAAPFLYDNERGKTIRVAVAGREFEIGETGADGHVWADVILSKDAVADALRAASLVQPRLPVSVAGKGNQDRHLSGWVYFVTESGLSVISDVDDTIKLTQVRDKKALMENTFLNDFQAIDGMNKLYGAWRDGGVSAFHYVSASPWQLYVPLRGFIADKGFPEGTLHLRPFRWMDGRFFNLFESPEKYKTDLIEDLLKRYPRRRFILVGDSTEADAAVYADIARRFPQQVAFILIRNVPIDVTARSDDDDDEADDDEQDDADAVRSDRPSQPDYEKLFKGIPQNRWRVFDNPDALPPLSDLIKP